MAIKCKQNHFPLTITKCCNRCGYRLQLCFSNLDPGKIEEVWNVSTLHSSIVQLHNHRFGHQHAFAVTSKQRQLSDSVEVD